MSKDTFTNWEALQVFEDTFKKCLELREKKGGEYAGDSDALANFRRNGEDCGLEMETIWRVYAGKHWDAISQWVKDNEKKVDRERLEPIHGRVDDLITYLLLFKCMLFERDKQEIVITVQKKHEVPDGERRS